MSVTAFDAEVDGRIDRAHRAFAEWRRVAPGDRASLLRRFAAAVDADTETLAALEVRNAETKNVFISTEE
jgi:acyl-CoA reductase-like NAD-dependent aldehyde dehydrogenase